VSKRFLPELQSKFAISSLGFALYSPISLLAFPVTVLVANPNSSYLLLLSYGAGLTFATYLQYLIFVVASSKISFKAVSIQVVFFLISSLVTGGVRGAIFYAIVDHLNLLQSGSLLNRVLASSFTAFIWLSTSNLLVNYIRDFKIKYEFALKQLLKRSIADSGEMGLSEESKTDLQNLQDDLLETLSTLLENSQSTELHKLATSLTSKINLELRPLSKRIWVRSLGEYPVIRFRRMVLDSVRFLDFSHFWFLGFMGALALLNNVFIRGFQESLIRTVSYLIILDLLLVVRNYGVLTNTLLFLVSVGVVPIYFGELIANILGYSGSWVAVLLITPVAPVVIVILSLIKLLQSDHELVIELLGTMRVRNQNAAQKEEMSAERQLASFIHNSLQSEFMALAGQLNEAAKSDNVELQESVKMRVSEVLDRSFIRDFNDFTQSPLPRLMSIQKSWKGILEIEVNIPDSLLQDSARNGLIVQTIEEFAANSFRHGKAKRIHIAGTHGEHGVKLSLRSDGPTSLTAQRGLGSEWLDQISKTPWTLESDTSGTLLTIEI
jgi:signal transduction histidine kinase